MDVPSTPPTLPDDLSALRVSTKFNSDSKVELSAKPTSDGADSPQTASKATFLTRKAHRFSTLKKKKNAANILNRLFYNSPPASTGAEKATNSPEEDSILEDMVASSSEENRSPQEASCTTGISRALKSASDNITLHAEEEVRDTIQDSFRQAGEQIMDACGKNTAASPPTVPDINFRHSMDEDEPSAPRFTSSWRASRDSSSGQSTEPSLVKVQQLQISTPSKTEITTPQAKVMKTPGGLSIPTPFTAGASGSSMFPSTMFSATKQPKRYSFSNDSKQVYPDLSQSSSETMDQSSTGLASLITQCVGSPVADSRSRTADDSIVLTRIVSSNDDLSTVAEASSSKETATFDEADADDEDFLPDDFKAVVHSNSQEKFYTLKELEDHITAAVATAKSEYVHLLLKDQEAKLQEAISECRSEAESLLEEHGNQWKTEHKYELDLIKAKYERKVNEHKDQAALANRLAKSKQAELDRMEGVVQSQDNVERQLSELQKELFSMQSAKNKEVAELKEKLAAQEAAVMDGFKAFEEAEAVANSQLLVDLNQEKGHRERLQSELDQVKVDVSTNEQLQSKLEQLKAELSAKQQLQSELDQVKAQLSVKEELQAELGQVKEQLSVKEQLLVQIKAELSVKEHLQSKLDDELAAKEQLLSELEEVKAELSAKQQLMSELGEIKAELSAKDQLQSEHDQLKADLAAKDQLQSELDQLKIELAAKEQLQSELNRVTIELSAKTSNTDEVLRLRNELAAAHTKLESHEKDLSTVESFEPELEKLAKELQNAQSLIERQEKMLDSVKKVEPELERVQSELLLVRKALSSKEEELAQTQDSRQLDLVKKELHDTKIRLENKEKEISERQSPARQASPSRRSTPSRLRSPSPSVILATPSKGTCSRRNCPGHGADERDRSAELLEQEKKNLRKQIALLENQAAKSKEAHQRTLHELRIESEQEIARVKKETEESVEKHMLRERELNETLGTVGSMEKEELLGQIENLQVEKQSDRNGFLREVQKKEDLLQRINQLEKREKEVSDEHERSMQDLRAKSDTDIQYLRKEMEKNEEARRVRERELAKAVSRTNSFEKEELLEKIEKLQNQLEQERHGAVLVKMKVAATEKEAKATENEQKEAIAELQAKLDAETKRYQQASDTLKIAQRSSDSVRRERDSLKEQVMKLDAELETIRHNYEIKIEEMRQSTADEIDTLRREAMSRMEYAQQESKLRVEAAQKAGYDMHMEQTKDLEDRILLLETQLVQREMQLKEERENAGFKASVKEKQLWEELRAMQELVKNKEARFHSGIKEVEEKHGKELDELLAQLDLVEAEHKEKVTEQEKSAAEKDSFITKLGAQLAEAQTQAQGVEDAQKELNEELEKARTEAKQCASDLLSSKKEVAALTESHQAFMKKVEETKEAACQEAREEMIERAEAQFKQANELYVKLKKQYDSSRSTIDQLQADLKVAESQLKGMEKEKDGCEIDLKAEIAQLKSSYAKIEADAAVKAKEYRKEMGGLLEAAKNFESKADQADSNGRTMQKKLTTITKEKAVLQKECDELRSVCEELMAIVEGGPRHEC